jgi:hypothetical protein
VAVKCFFFRIKGPNDMDSNSAAPAVSHRAHSRKRARTTLVLDIEESRESLQLLRAALDQLWRARDRAAMTGIESAHDKVNRELIEQGGELFSRLYQHVDSLQETLHDASLISRSKRRVS